MVCVCVCVCACVYSSSGGGGAVSLVPLSGWSGLYSSIDFGHAISANIDLAGFRDACRLPADLCRQQLGVLLVVVLAS